MPTVHVAAAVLSNRHGEVLIALRHKDAHQGGLWEFPGGKLEPGEHPRRALDRELWEELGITVKEAKPLIRVPHTYDDRSVLLDVWRVVDWDGQPHGREGQTIDWVLPDMLHRRRFPVADRAILTAVRLPSMYLLTPEPGDHEDVFLRILEQRLEEGIRLVQFRAKSLGEMDYGKLAESVLNICHNHSAKLLLNAEPALVPKIGAHGVHLTSGRLRRLNSRPLADTYWIGASCHDADAIAHAGRVGVDFAVVAPVQTTDSHPSVTPMGWRGFRDLAEHAVVPVYALGGMTMGDLEVAQQHGAQGIAAIRALWCA